MHIPVLLNEVIDSLDLKPSDIVLDGTIGSAGHAHFIRNVLDEEGMLIGIDQDSESIKRSQDILEQSKSKVPFVLIQGNFRNSLALIQKHNIQRVDKVLLDLGWSSDQLTDTKKGFSFQIDAPLDMRLNTSLKEGESFNAYDIVNTWEEENIADIIYAYGEEVQSRRIADAICTYRQNAPITTTTQLAKIINDAVGHWHGKKINPATKTFQALRICVNDELGSLKEFLETIPNLVKTGGRVSIITFQSLEDRIVKQSFKEFESKKIAKLINKKVIIPTHEEILMNRRSRTAKLRTLEII